LPIFEATFARRSASRSCSSQMPLDLSCISSLSAFTPVNAHTLRTLCLTDIAALGAVAAFPQCSAHSGA
jgi:hypothetical protein